MNDIKKLQQRKELVAKELEKISVAKENAEKMLFTLNKQYSSKEKELKEINDLSYALNRDKWHDMLLDTIIIGTRDIKVHHGMIAPHQHGYTIEGKVICSSNWMKELPDKLYDYFFGVCNWTDKDFEQLQNETEKLWNELPLSYNPEVYKKDENAYRGYIANGYETDGFSEIALGHCKGDYSSYTTCSQNALAMILIAFKGYCPEAILNSSEFSPTLRSKLEEVYSRHNIDSNLSDLDAWAKRNPTRCCSNSQYYISKEEYDGYDYSCDVTITYKKNSKVIKTFSYKCPTLDNIINKREEKIKDALNSISYDLTFGDVLVEGTIEKNGEYVDSFSNFE